MLRASEALAIARAGIRAVDPARAVSTAFRPSGVAARWARRHAVAVVALGKASEGMVGSAARALGARFAGGIAVVPQAPTREVRGVEFLVGSHPVPTGASFRAGAALLQFVGRREPGERVLFLISGGGSSLAEAPAEGLGLSAIRRATEGLLASGAPIGAMNVIRRHVSALKGGRLAVACRSSGSLTLAISDVVGDRPEEVASGPTVGDPTTFQDALTAVERYRLEDRLPRDVLSHLESGARGAAPETVKPGDVRLRGAKFRFVATNRVALAGAAAEARRRGYAVRTLGGHLTGETVPVAREFAGRLLRLRGGRPRALLGGGETTVTLAARHGKGGRNQEFALAAALPLDGRPQRLVLSVGTDGIDGPTDAAGGWADDRTAARARSLGIDLPERLARHDAYSTLTQLGALLVTGRTGTNVMDLHVGLFRPARAPAAGSLSRAARPSR